eukprot:5831329-Prymnesium_polylepis.1
MSSASCDSGEPGCVAFRSIAASRSACSLLSRSAAASRSACRCPSRSAVATAPCDFVFPRGAGTGASDVRGRITRSVAAPAGAVA